MAIPRWTSFVEPMLRFLSSCHEPAPRSEVQTAVAETLGVTAAERRLTTPSGKIVYKDRAGWAYNWLKREGLAYPAAGGKWQLTERGREVGEGTQGLPVALRENLDSKYSGKSTNRTARSLKLSSTRGDRKAYRCPSQPLATGGQADVFEAVRLADNKMFVLKRIPPKRAGSSDNERMRREIQVQTQVVHDNIMPIIDWDVVSYTWYVMPRGRTSLSALPRPLTSSVICHVVHSILAALEAAHAVGQPHRDIKPQNIIELDDGKGPARWVLADWGLTRPALGKTSLPLTKTGQFIGTEGFAPPEAYQGAHAVGLVGDVYSLGQLVAWTLGVDPIPNRSPSISGTWKGFVERTTQQEPSKRPQTVAEVAALLREVCSSGSGA